MKIIRADYNAVDVPNILLVEQVQEDEVRFTISKNLEKSFFLNLVPTLEPSEKMDASGFEKSRIRQRNGKGAQ